MKPWTWIDYLLVAEFAVLAFFTWVQIRLNTWQFFYDSLKPAGQSCLRRIGFIPNETKRCQAAFEIYLCVCYGLWVLDTEIKPSLGNEFLWLLLFYLIGLVLDLAIDLSRRVVSTLGNVIILFVLVFLAFTVFVHWH